MSRLRLHHLLGQVHRVLGLPKPKREFYHQQLERGRGRILGEDNAQFFICWHELPVEVIGHSDPVFRVSGIGPKVIRWLLVHNALQRLESFAHFPLRELHPSLQIEAIQIPRLAGADLHTETGRLGHTLGLQEEVDEVFLRLQACGIEVKRLLEVV